MGMKKYRNNIIFCVVAFLLLAISALNMKTMFYSDYDSSYRFVENNYSNSITADNTTTLNVKLSKKQVRTFSLQFVANSEMSADTTVNVKVIDKGAGSVVYDKNYSGEQLLKFNQVKFTPDRQLEKGDELAVVLSTDAQTEESAFRITMGNKVKSDIISWEYNGIIDTDNTPGLHIIYYNHFGVTSFVFYLICFGLAILFIGLPKNKWTIRLGKLAKTAILLGMPMAMIYCTEYLVNYTILDKPVIRIFFNYVIVLAVELLFTGLLANISAGIIAATLVTAAVSILNHYVLLYRGNIIAPYDLYSITAAMAVSSQYSFDIDMKVLMTLCVSVVIIAGAIRYSTRVFSKEKQGKIISRLAVMAVSVSILVFCGSATVGRISQADVNMFKYKFGVMNNGTFFNFAQSIRHMQYDVPEGYNQNDVVELSQNYPATPGDGLQPDIILVMNESFADLSTITTLNTNADPLAYLHSIENSDIPNLYTGTVVMPTYGASTCNSEMESTTGYSIANFDVACIPLVQYFNGDEPTLRSLLAKQGYNTTFIHPGVHDSYNRKSIYTNMNYDNIFFEDVFMEGDYDTICDFYSDKSCYDMTFDTFDKNPDKPNFAYVLTIQNHGSWAHLKMDNSIWLTDTAVPYKDIDNYLSMIDHSDEALQHLIETVSKREKPTIVLFFGDHQPTFAEDIWEHLGYHNAVAARPQAQYETPCVIYANYDIDLSFVPEVFSSNYIPAVLAKLSGTEISGFYNMMLEMMEEAPVYSVVGAFDNSGNAVDTNNEKFLQYKYIQYAMIENSNILSNEFTGKAE